MVKQPPYTISQTARSPWKLLQLGKRLNSQKTGSAKKKQQPPRPPPKKLLTKKIHRTREEVKLTDTQQFSTWQNVKRCTAIVHFPSKKKIPVVGYKTGHFMGSDAAAAAACPTGAVTGCQYFPVLKAASDARRDRCPPPPV